MTIKLTATLIIQKQQRLRQYRPTKRTPLFRYSVTLLILKPCWNYLVKKLMLSCKKINTKTPIRHCLQY